MSYSSKKIGIVLGTRPEFIKFFSLLQELKRREWPFFIIHTGQHYSPNLDDVFFKELGLPEPHYRLQSGSKHLGEQISYIVNECSRIFLQENPDLILVQGDTNSVLAGALAGNKENISVGHIEAGLRSNNPLMAEERNRVVTSYLANFLFAPTEEACANLQREGFDEQKVLLAGNTIADAVTHFARLTDEKSTILKNLKLTAGNFFLVTIHRAECTDSKKNLTNVVYALNELAQTQECPLVFAMHPRTKKYISEYSLEIDPAIKVIEPVGYFDFLALLKSCRLAITDSGGVQEEGCILGVPVVTVREDTERPETVRIGANILAGFEPKNIVEAVQEMLSRPRTWTHPYGENVAQKILNFLEASS